jgi:hypothetical protein
MVSTVLRRDHVKLGLPLRRVVDPRLLNRRRPGRWRAAAGADVVAAAVGVFVRRRQIVGHGLGLSPLPRLGVVEKSLQERPTPTATRAGAVALGQLADAARAFDADEVLDLPPRDVKAEAKLVVRFHLLRPRVLARRWNKAEQPL